ncbi:MAG: peptidase S8, partial [Chitinophagaceae bacterium]
AVKYAEEKGVLLVHAAGNDNEDVDKVDNFPNKYYETEETIAYKKKKEKPPVAIRPLNNQGQGMGNPDFNRIDRVKPVTDTIRFAFAHAKNWVEVGASAYKDEDLLKANFSNYGKRNVDVFAPGYLINSTIPNSKYDEHDGTSMAAPVVSGLSALILSYYPHLTPAQVREILIRSVTKINRKVKYTNERGESVRVPFADITLSGGIVNAYNALKLAETYK